MIDDTRRTTVVRHQQGERSGGGSHVTMVDKYATKRSEMGQPKMAETGSATYDTAHGTR